MRTIIVTGGRNYNDHVIVQEVLNIINPDLIVQGGAFGADELARRYAQIHGIQCITIEANWNLHGRFAGPKRNIEMLEMYPTAIVVAFPGGKGTENCIKEASKRNKIILQVKERNE